MNKFILGFICALLATKAMEMYAPEAMASAPTYIERQCSESPEVTRMREIMERMRLPIVDSGDQVAQLINNLED